MKNTTIRTTRLTENKNKSLATLKIDRLNLGNNFTYNHFIGAINERMEQCNKLVECIQKLEHSEMEEIQVIAEGNFCKVMDTFVTFEFFELLDADANINNVQPDFL